MTCSLETSFSLIVMNPISLIPFSWFGKKGSF
jgi:hypothetical protein